MLTEINVDMLVCLNLCLCVPCANWDGRSESEDWGGRSESWSVLELHLYSASRLMVGRHLEVPSCSRTCACRL